MSRTRCITPISVKNKKTGRLQEVPCSRCWPCLQRRADGWAFRILQEKKRSRSALFVTLTYDDAHVPINDKMQITLDKKAIPLYMKRLRKLHSKVDYPDKLPLKYYAVGEYGENFERPHYHIILFNALPELVPLAWSIDGVMFGMVQIGDKGVTAGGARYLCEYMLTGQGNNDDLRQRPFSLMSKNLGDNYLTDAMKRWHLAKTGKPVVLPDGTVVKTRDRYYAISDGYRIALPRYYRDRIFCEMYRSIDVPLITGQFADKEYDEMARDFVAYARNLVGQVETNKSTYSKKQKQKNRFKAISEA